MKNFSPLIFIAARTDRDLISKYFYHLLTQTEKLSSQSSWRVQLLQERLSPVDWLIMMTRNAESCKKLRLVPGYYFANCCNGAVSRIGFIFHDLYHRLICFSSYKIHHIIQCPSTISCYQQITSFASRIKSVLFLFPNTLEQAVETKFLLGRIRN